MMTEDDIRAKTQRLRTKLIEVKQMLGFKNLDKKKKERLQIQAAYLNGSIMAYADVLNDSSLFVK